MIRYCFRTTTVLVLLILASDFVAGQVAEKWDLQKCVNHALQNNITVRQAELQAKFADLEFQLSKMAQYPTMNFSGNVGYGAGRNQDPTSFGLITTSYVFNNYSLQSSVDIFNWFTKKKTIKVKDLDLQATKEGAEKVKNDIALNVAVAYLQILLAREQIELTRSKLAQTHSELESTRKQVEAGKLPELNAVNLESLLAADSSSFVTATTTAQQYLLNMKALLNMDAGAPFDITTPPVNLIPLETLADLQPEAVFTLATQNMPQQKVDELNLRSANTSVELAKGRMYPSFTMFGSLGSSFNNRAKEAKSKSTINVPVGTVTVGATSYQVFPLQPYEIYNYGNIPYFDQINNNFRQSIGIGLSVPILNGGTLRGGWKRAQLNVKQVELRKEQNSFTLKQDIYKAYNDAVAAMQKYNANKKAVEASEKAYAYAVKRYDVGLLSSYDLVTSQNNLQSAKSQLLYSQYDYVFKMKLLEFYKGQGLKL